VRELGVEEEKVTPDARLVADLAVDELDRVELVMAVEQAFDIEISDEDEDSAKWATINDVVKAVRKRVR
jgi:acyl carrier protein